MTDRQFLWGLSNGIGVFAIAGTFWYGLGVSSVLTARTDWRVWCLSTLVQLGACVGLLWAAVRLRGRSGFRSSDLSRGDEAQQAETRRIRAGFRWTTLGQAVAIALVAWWCVRADMEARIWPWIGLIVSLHLVPLARLFHVRAYYVTALLGSLVATATLVRPATPDALAYLGGGLAATMWLSAAYLVWQADSIASAAVRGPASMPGT